MNKILLVEDDLALAMGIEYSLKAEGYIVDVAHEVKTSKTLIDENNYDLIILDVMLPDGNGFQLCEYIRQDNNTPVIFLTAQDEEVNIVMGLELGGDDYITKPFRIKELLSRIKAVLRRTKGVRDKGILISNNIKLSQIENSVYSNDKEIQLTPSEFKLLVNLMKHPRQALTRLKILEDLWDVDGDFIDDNTLSVYIRRLREKIEEDSSNPIYIKTVRGIGYRWDVDVRG